GQGFDRIVVGYGFCGKGLVGARAAEQPLVIPMVPDCIALLLGSAERYRELRAQEPGTYFLTRGWVEHGGGPLDKAAAYRAALGRAGAASAVRRELRHYKRLLWIETNVDPDGRFQARAREQARSLGLSFEAVTGDPGLLAEMLRGGGDGRFRVIPPGASVGADMYLDL
ncbi:MAG TPA: DUF1638 domain-containing protein, partial [Deferrisomatales bacterium]|nr:DUF1638 domain-containing protein [Deferrisomatales bacterium]